jgi:phosphoglycerate dehydrogenase-like enzyme
LHTVDRLDALLPEADVVVLNVPDTPGTARFMDGARFSLMSPTSIFVNVGRGPTVVLDDLVDALHAGRPAAAALDVYDIEPLPAQHPLWNQPNVILTPHIGGIGDQLDQERLAFLIDNARRFAKGRSLRNAMSKAS